MFDYDRAEQSAGWLKELNNEHTPETEEYGISSFVFRDHRPFHPERFWQYVNRDWPGNVIRSKGLFWLASRPDQALIWSQAGGSIRADAYGRWWASVPELERMLNPVYVECRQAIMEKWDEQWGDRMNELVIIGLDLDEEAISRELRKCLVNSLEGRAVVAGHRFEDNWPVYT